MPGAQSVEACDRVFAALSHRTRRQILYVLHFRGGRMKGREIADRFSCRWPTISRHLAVLREAGLVELTREGRERLYTVDMKAIEQVVLGWFSEVHRSPESSPPAPRPARLDPKRTAP